MTRVAVTAEWLGIELTTSRSIALSPIYSNSVKSLNYTLLNASWQLHITSSSFRCTESAAASLRWRQAIWSCSLGTWSCSVALSHSAVFSCCSSRDTLSDSNAICLSALHFAWRIITTHRVNSAYYP